MSESRKTPLTNALLVILAELDGTDINVVRQQFVEMLDHARTLERELAQTREELKETTAMLDESLAHMQLALKRAEAAESALHTSRAELADADKTLETIRVAMGTSTVWEGLNVIDRLRDEAHSSRAAALKMAEALYGSFAVNNGGDYTCVHCECPIDINKWTTTKHDAGCIINDAIALAPSTAAQGKDWSR